MPPPTLGEQYADGKISLKELRVTAQSRKGKNKPKIANTLNSFFGKEKDKEDESDDEEGLLDYDKMFANLELNKDEEEEKQEQKPDLIQTVLFKKEKPVTKPKNPFSQEVN